MRFFVLSITYFISLLTSCIFINAAQAQQIDCWPHCEPVVMRPMVEADPPMSKEAFLNFCENDTKFSNMFECGCLSESYDAMRIQLGQDGGHEAIKQRIIDTCRNTKRAGELMYQNCVGSPPFTFNPTPEYGIQQFCHCVGDKYAELYKAAPPPYPQATLSNFQLEAQYFCKTAQ